jgi:hypothetical protein
MERMIDDRVGLAAARSGFAGSLPKGREPRPARKRFPTPRHASDGTIGRHISWTGDGRQERECQCGKWANWERWPRDSRRAIEYAVIPLASSRWQISMTQRHVLEPMIGWMSLLRGDKAGNLSIMT